MKSKYYIIKITLVNVALCFATQSHASVCTNYFSSRAVEVSYIKSQTSSNTLIAKVNTKIIGFAKYLSGQNGEVVFLTSGLVKKTHRRKGVQSKLVEKIIETEQPKIVSYSIQGTNQEAFFLAIAEGVHQKLINEVIRKHIDIKKQAQLGKTYLMNYFKALEQNKFYRAMQESIIEDAAFNTPTGKTLEKAGFDRVNITYEGLHRTDDGSKDLSIYLYFSKEKPNI